MTNLEWVRNMDAEQLARDIIAACDHYDCAECPKYSTCTEGKDAMEWLMEEHVEAEG